MGNVTPPSGAEVGDGGGPPQHESQLTVPAWVVSDWPQAAAMGLIAYAIIVGVGILAAVTVTLSTVIRFSSDALELGSILATPFALPIAYLGGYDGTPVLLTGLLVLAIALRVGSRPVGLTPGHAMDRTRALAWAGKVAVVFVTTALVVAIVLDVVNADPAAQPGGLISDSVAFRIDYVRLVFVSGPVVFVVALMTLGRLTGRGILGLLGLRGSMPAVVRSSAAGLARTLKISLVGLLVLFAVGTLLELATDNFLSGSDLVAALLSFLVVTVLLACVDVAALFLVVAMSFLQYDTFSSAAWQWVGVALVAIAFFLGGRRAAQYSNARTMAEAVVSSSLIGVLLAAVGVVVAIDYTAAGGAEGFAAPAILLPLLWTLPAAAGAWFYANENGLPSGVAVAPQPSDPHATATQPRVATDDLAPRDAQRPTEPPDDDAGPPPPSGPRRG